MTQAAAGERGRINENTTLKGTGWEEKGIGAQVQNDTLSAT